MHAGEVQVVLDPGYVHAVAEVPPQVPRQASAVPAHAVRVPRGGPEMVEHFPGDEASPHA